MDSKSQESPPPTSDLVIKTRRQSVMDSPSRVTRSQLRRVSLSQEVPSSPKPSPPRRSRAVRSAQSDIAEEEEKTSPHDGLSAKLKDEEATAPSSPAPRRSRASLSSISTRTRRSVSEDSTNDHTTTHRRSSMRLPSIVEDSSGVTTRRTSLRVTAVQASDDAGSVELPKRRTRSSVGGASVIASVSSPSRSTRGRRRLSPVPSPTASEVSVVSVASPVKCESSPSASMKGVSPEKITSPKHSPKSSSGKKIGVVSPSRALPFKSPLSKDQSGNTPRRLLLDDLESPEIVEANAGTTPTVKSSPKKPEAQEKSPELSSFEGGETKQRTPRSSMGRLSFSSDKLSQALKNDTESVTFETENKAQNQRTSLGKSSGTPKLSQTSEDVAKSYGSECNGNKRRSSSGRLSLSSAKSPDTPKLARSSERPSRVSISGSDTKGQTPRLSLGRHSLSSNKSSNSPSKPELDITAESSIMSPLVYVSKMTPQQVTEHSKDEGSSVKKSARLSLRKSCTPNKKPWVVTPQSDRKQLDTEDAVFMSEEKLAVEEDSDVDGSQDSVAQSSRSSPNKSLGQTTRASQSPEINSIELPDQSSSGNVSSLNDGLNNDDFSIAFTSQMDQQAEEDEPTPSVVYKTPAKSPASSTRASKTPAKSPAVNTPVSKTPANSPAINTPASKTPAKSPANDAPASQSTAKSPAISTPASKTLAKSPAISTPGSKTPGKSPAIDTPASKTPAKSSAFDTPASQTPAKSPAISTPASKTPGKSPAIDTPASKTPAKSPTFDTPASKTPAKSPAISAPASKTPAKSPAISTPGSKTPGKSKLVSPAKSQPSKTATPVKSPFTETKASPASVASKSPGINISRASIGDCKSSELHSTSNIIDVESSDSEDIFSSQMNVSAVERNGTGFKQVISPQRGKSHSESELMQVEFMGRLSSGSTSNSGCKSASETPDCAGSGRHSLGVSTKVTSTTSKAQSSACTGSDSSTYDLESVFTVFEKEKSVTPGQKSQENAGRKSLDSSQRMSLIMDVSEDLSVEDEEVVSTQKHAGQPSQDENSDTDFSDLEPVFSTARLSVNKEEVADSSLTKSTSRRNSLKVQDQSAQNSENMSDSIEENFMKLSSGFDGLFADFKAEDETKPLKMTKAEKKAAKKKQRKLQKELSINETRKTVTSPLECDKTAEPDDTGVPELNKSFKGSLELELLEADNDHDQGVSEDAHSERVTKKKQKKSKAQHKIDEPENDENIDQIIENYAGFDVESDIVTAAAPPKDKKKKRKRKLDEGSEIADLVVDVPKDKKKKKKLKIQEAAVSESCVILPNGDSLSAGLTKEKKKKKKQKLSGTESLVDFIEETEMHQMEVKKVGDDLSEHKQKKKKKKLNADKASAPLLIENDTASVCSKLKKKKKKEKKTKFVESEEIVPQSSVTVADSHTKHKRKKLSDSEDIDTHKEGKKLKQIQEDDTYEEVKIKKRKRTTEPEDLSENTLKKSKVESGRKELKKLKKLKKLLQTSDPPRESTGHPYDNQDSDDEAPTAVSFSASREAALSELQAAAETIRKERERKREKRRLKQEEVMKQKAAKILKLKKRESEELADLPETSSKQKLTGTVPKRLPYNIIVQLPERPQPSDKSVSRDAKSKEQLQRLKDKRLISKIEKQNRKQSQYIPLQNISGATRFGVVPLRNIMASGNKMADSAANFRKEMLFGNRVKRTPVAETLAHQEKLKASGNIRFSK